MAKVKHEEFPHMQSHMKTLILSLCLAVSASLGVAQPKKSDIPLGKRVPVRVAIQWLGGPESKAVYDTVLADLTNIGVERVSYKDYWNFCVYLATEATTDSTSGTKWYAISIQIFNRLKFFAAYQGIPFEDHDSFIHRFPIINEPESISVISQPDLQKELKAILGRLNHDVFSTVQSYD